jgi:hypothetical protein
MKLSELHPAEDLRSKLLATPGFNYTVWTAQEVPSAGWPDAFFRIALNGAIERYESAGEVYRANLLVEMNSKLLATGAANLPRHQLMLEAFEGAMKLHQGYTKRPSTVYEGKNLIANYSTKIINILVYLTKNT